MNSPGAAAPNLSADLVPFISQPAVDMVVARVMATQLAPEVQDGLEQEVGTAVFRVAGVIHHGSLRDGEEIQVPMARVADRLTRARNTRNQWNALPLDAGRLVLLACRGTPGSNVYTGLGAIALATATSPVVAAIRDAYAIEEFSGPPQQRPAMVAAALVSPEAQLRFYALDLLGRRAVFGREHGAELLSRVIRSDKGAPNDRLDLGDYLTRLYFFKPDLKADATNVNVVATLATALVAETDPERRLSWMRLLASTVQGEFSARAADDQAIRQSLIRAIRAPSPGQVIQALDSLSGQADPQEQTMIAELKQVWQQAGGR